MRTFGHPLLRAHKKAGRLRLPASCRRTVKRVRQYGVT